MNWGTTTEAIREAQRFIEAASKALETMHPVDMCPYGNSKTGAARRASMDLTRALAEMRKAYRGKAK